MTTAVSPSAGGGPPRCRGPAPLQRPPSYRTPSGVVNHRRKGAYCRTPTPHREEGYCATPTPARVLSDSGAPRAPGAGTRASLVFCRVLDAPNLASLLSDLTSRRGPLLETFSYPLSGSHGPHRRCPAAA